MKLVIISDTHEYHQVVKVPDGDVLIHCGDFTHIGHSGAIERFLEWFASQEHKHKIFICGNHEIEGMNEDLIPNGVIYLENNSCIIDGVKFYGSPYTPKFYDWGFQYEREHADWSHIPNDTDVLITHGPPLGILDYVPGGGNVGCESLLQRVKEVAPKLHCFGHIHYSSGEEVVGETKFINAACCNEAYIPLNKSYVFHI
jgi:Icc-related predicted phosphoesterase